MKEQFKKTHAYCPQGNFLVTKRICELCPCINCEGKDTFGAYDFIFNGKEIIPVDKSSE